MKATEFGKTFNTTLQNVDEKYKWVNDMIKARQDLVLMYMKILNMLKRVVRYIDLLKRRNKLRISRLRPNCASR